MAVFTVKAIVAAVAWGVSKIGAGGAAVSTGKGIAIAGGTAVVGNEIMMGGQGPLTQAMLGLVPTYTTYNIADIALQLDAGLLNVNDVFPPVSQTGDMALYEMDTDVGDPVEMMAALFRLMDVTHGMALAQSFQALRVQKQGTIIGTPAVSQQGTIIGTPATPQEGTIIGTPVTPRQNGFIHTPAILQQPTILDTPVTVLEQSNILTSGMSIRDSLLDTVENPKLRNAINEIYRPGATVGDGGLADAVRHELETGELVGGKSHIRKAEERIVNLENVIKKQNLNETDLDVAQKLLDELKNALGGN
ncbi:MAG: hypothetical protein FWE02_02465 [Defluviitaleaceae bacterium]|nr:hypothetical protein [Defluviitaleaceae bacterium]